MQNNIILHKSSLLHGSHIDIFVFSLAYIEYLSERWADCFNFTKIIRPLFVSIDCKTKDCYGINNGKVMHLGDKVLPEGAWDYEENFQATID